MSVPDDSRPRVLVVGGTGGLLGRALAPEILPNYRVRSVHRHPLPAEIASGVEWVSADVAEVRDWRPMLEGVDRVVNLAWYRQAPAYRFERLARGLGRLLEAAVRSGVSRFIQVSVPIATPSIEADLPYMRFKRQFDRQLSTSGLSHRILRPTAMFGRGDVLLGVMMRTIYRYPFFVMFGDGSYHLSPIAASDVARAIRLELERTSSGTDNLGGAERFTYRALTDRMFALLGKPSRYWRLSPRGSRSLAALLEGVGSSLLYAYEVEWLLADLLGLPPYTGLDRPLEPVGPYLAAEAARLRDGTGARAPR